MTPFECALAAARAYDEPPTRGDAGALPIMISRHDVEVLVERHGEALLVSPRGTEANGWGLLWDGSRDLRAAPLWDRHLGVCHAGFRGGVRAIWPQLEPILQQAKRDQLRIYFEGHSLGGSLAIGLAVYCFNLVKRPAGWLTLGAPALGGRRIGRVLRAIGPSKGWRVVHGADVVPRVPPWFPHHAEAVQLGPRAGWHGFTDHQVKRYLDQLDGFPGAHEAF